jgi:hypothetical protein
MLHNFAPITPVFCAKTQFCTIDGQSSLPVFESARGAFPQTSFPFNVLPGRPATGPLLDKRLRPGFRPALA